jgi:hypothetical protein
MKTETIERGNQLLEIKKKLENHLKEIEKAQENQAMPVTRIGFSYERNSSYFIVRDHLFIEKVIELWKKKVEVELAETILEIEAL